MAHAEARGPLRKVSLGEKSQRGCRRAITGMSARVRSGIDQLLEINVGAVQSCREFTCDAAPNACPDGRRTPGDNSTGQDKKRRIREVAKLRFGKKLREALPSSFIGLAAVTADHARKPRDRPRYGFLAPVWGIHQIGASGQLAEDAVDIGLAANHSFIKGVQPPANGTSLGPDIKKLRTRPV